MASLHKRGNKYDISINYNGKQLWVPGERNIRETTQIIDNILYQFFFGNLSDASLPTDKTTVKDFLIKWLTSYGAHNLKRTTYETYSTYINRGIIPALGKIPLVELTPARIQSFYYDFELHGRINGDAPLAPKTVTQVHRILHKAFKRAVQFGIIDKNPTDYVDLPKKKKFISSILEEEEIPDFINNFRDTEIYNAVLISLFLGLRRGEVLALQWEDISFDNGEIRINKNLTSANNIVDIQSTKTESSSRIIAIPGKLLKYLRSYQKENSLADDDYIIRTIKNKRFTPSNFDYRYKKIRDDSNTKKIRFHDLRHSNATLMFSKNIDAKVMQQRLGHADITTTFNIYVKTSRKDQEEASIKLDLDIDY